VERDGVLVAERGEDVAPLDWEAVRAMVERQRPVAPIPTYDAIEVEL